MEKSEIESYVKAGEIAREVKKFARGLIKPGIKLIDVAEAIDGKIFELGGEPAFPVNLSLNEIAAHYTPAPGDETVAEGILKVDLGVAVDGYIADTAFSVDLTDGGEFSAAARGIPSKEGTGVPSSSGMMELNEKILEEATKKIRVGMKICEIGEACQKTLEEWNNKNNSDFSIIKNLSGHSLGRNEIHAGLTISNYGNDNQSELSGAFAIEPFVTTGVGNIYEGQPGGIYVLQSDNPVRDRNAREVLKFIKDKFVTRPFCLRWLTSWSSEGRGSDATLTDIKEKQVGARCSLVGGSGVGNRLTENKLKFILAMLVKQKILYEYPMLIEKSKSPVSQFENTFVIADGKVLCTTG